jgi:hypothetical protein
MDAQSKGAKRPRIATETGDGEDGNPGSEAAEGELLVVLPELQARLGRKFCGETELLALLLAHGCIRRVRTVEVDVHPLGGDSFKVKLDAAKPTVAEAKAEIACVHGTTQCMQELYRIVVRADGGVVREDDAEPELLTDVTELANREQLAMAVKGKSSFG